MNDQDTYFENITPVTSAAKNQLLGDPGLARLQDIIHTLQPSKQTGPFPIGYNTIRMPLGVFLINPDEFASTSRELGVSSTASGRYWFPPGLVTIPFRREDLPNIDDPSNRFKDVLSEELIHAASTILLSKEVRLGFLSATLNGTNSKSLHKLFLKLPRFDLSRITIAWASMKPDYLDDLLLNTKLIHTNTATEDKDKYAILFTEFFTSFIKGALSLTDPASFLDAAEVLNLLRHNQVNPQYFARLAAKLVSRGYFIENADTFAEFSEALPPNIINSNR